MCYTVAARPVCPRCAGRTGLADTVEVEKTCKLAARCPYRQWRPLPHRKHHRHPRREDDEDEESVVSRRRCAACVRRASTANASPAGTPPDSTTTSTTSAAPHGFAAMSRAWEVQRGMSPPGRLGEAYPEKENRGFWKAVFGARQGEAP